MCLLLPMPSDDRPSSQPPSLPRLATEDLCAVFLSAERCGQPESLHPSEIGVAWRLPQFSEVAGAVATAFRAARLSLLPYRSSASP